MIEIIYTNGENKDFIDLCKLLDESLTELVGNKIRREKYIPYNTLDNIHDVFLLYDDKLPIGCVSFKYYDENIAEIKRMFVRKEYRGKGLSKLLLLTLEQKVKSKGNHTLLLESGEPLYQAMGLYHKMGYSIIDNYGQYKDMPESICMQKKL